MSTMIREVYDALIEAGASPEKAGKAAESVASYDDRFSRLERGQDNLQAQLNLLRWMVGFNLAFTMAIVWKVFS